MPGEEKLENTNKKIKRVRINFSEAQLHTMEVVFKQSQYPDVTVLEILSDKLQLPLEKLCTWFQNRRSKFRRESRKGHIEWMREQLYRSTEPQLGLPTNSSHQNVNSTLTKKDSVLTPVPKTPQDTSNAPVKQPMLNLYQVQPAHSLVALPPAGELRPGYHDATKNNNNNIISKSSYCYYNYHKYVNNDATKVDLRSSLSATALSSSSTCTSWSCTTPNMSTPQNNPCRRIHPDSISPDNMMGTKSYPSQRNHIECRSHPENSLRSNNNTSQGNWPVTISPDNTINSKNYITQKNSIPLDNSIRRKNNISQENCEAFINPDNSTGCSNYTSHINYPESTSPENTTGFKNYPFQQTFNYQFYTDYSCHGDTANINSNSLPSVLPNHTNTFNNCHFYGPISF